MLAKWRGGPKDTVASKAKATRRGGTRVLLPMLDASTLPAQAGVPIPEPGTSPKGCTRYDVIFDKLKADGMAVPGIPDAYCGALQKAATTYLDARPTLKASSTFTVRRLGDGKTCGVWRLARSVAAALPGPGRKTRAAAATTTA